MFICTKNIEYIHRSISICKNICLFNCKGNFLRKEVVKTSEQITTELNLPLELCNRFNQLKEDSSKALNTTGI